MSNAGRIQITIAGCLRRASESHAQLRANYANATTPAADRRADNFSVMTDLGTRTLDYLPASPFALPMAVPHETA